MIEHAPKIATVFGAGGFVGGHLSQYLRGAGYRVREVMRGDASWRGADLGVAFYTIGLTADFRVRPFEAIDAHVSVLTEILRTGDFSSLVYCSSTRVYSTCETTRETQRIAVDPSDPDHLYNISKLMGESACLGSGIASARVARLSNVFGDDLTSANFLSSVMKDALQTGQVHLRSSLSSAKDYVAVNDVVRGLEAIGRRGVAPITNVAFGRNTTHEELLAAISRATGAVVTVEPGAPTLRFPEIETATLDAILPGPRQSVLAHIPALVEAFQA